MKVALEILVINSIWLNDREIVVMNSPEVLDNLVALHTGHNFTAYHVT